MKKIQYMFLLLLISMITVLGGCGAKGEETPQADDQQAENTDKEQAGDQEGQETSKTDENTQGSEEDGGDIDPSVQFAPPKSGEEIGIITTNMGTIKVKFFPQYAPKAVENFTTHAKEGYYDGLIFHRAINDFMIQGGDPLGTGMGGESIWGEPFEDEFNPNVLNYRGALSSANSGPNTNKSQFFIVQKKEVEQEILDQMKSGGYPDKLIKTFKERGGTPWLNFKHTVFGQVFEGMDVVDAIAAVDTLQDEDHKDKPVEDVVIEKIEIVKYQAQ